MMNWEQLLCEKRETISVKKSTDNRNEFRRDYHRIIGSASFRRLQDKTQVFSLDRGDFVRTRLTHSLEVSSFAKSLGQACFIEIQNKYSGTDIGVTDLQIDKICCILECAGLIHDIGNPPFGHFGEDTIREWFRNNLSSLKLDGIEISKIIDERMKNDLLNFEGNAQALRLLTKLHYLVDDNGMHLTYGLLNTIIKYPVSSVGINKKSGNIKDKKMGYYYSEEKIFNDITSSTGAGGNRYPLVYLLEASDDIAYCTADTEDAVKKGLLTYDILLRELNDEESFSVLDTDEKRKKYEEIVKKLTKCLDRAKAREIKNPEVNAVQNWIIQAQNELINEAKNGFVNNYMSIMDGTFKGEVLTSEKEAGSALIMALRRISVKYIYSAPEITKLELSANTMLCFLLDHLVPAAVKGESAKSANSIEKKYLSLISDNYIRAYNTAAKGADDREKLYLRLLLVTDYICGMTDSFAKDLCRKLNGII